MKKLLVLATLALTWSASAAEWLSDLPTALKRAREEDKAVLLDFTGSDWCIWCKKLKAEVFDKPAFQNFADANLVLVEVDFPHNKKISPELAAANKKLAETYQIQGFPTVVLLGSDQKFLGKTGYQPGGPEAFLGELEKMPTVKRREPVAQPIGRDPFSTPIPKTVEMPGPAAKIEYKGLALKGISGTKSKRFALVNNQSLAQGESGLVKVHDAKIKVTCKEIRDDSVVLDVEGKPEPVELQLGKAKELDTPAEPKPQANVPAAAAETKDTNTPAPTK